MSRGMRWAKIACWAGPSSLFQAKSCTKQSDWDDFLHNESKHLALPWGRAPRLDFGARVRNHVVRMAGVRPLSLQSSIVTACGVVPRAVNIARLCFFSTARLPSSAIAGFSAIITRLGFNFFSSTTGTIDSVKSILTQTALDALCEKYYIPNVVHPKLPGSNDRIRNSPTGKIDLSVIAAAKVSHFEILCRVHGFVSTVDSLKNWNDHFFWVDASVFPLAVPWHNDKTLRKDPHPTPAEFNVDVYNYLADNHAPFRKFLEPFVCFVGISRYYDLDENCYPTFWANDDEEMDLFAFINHADLNKVRIGERKTEQGEHVVDVGGIDVVVDAEVRVIVVDKPQIVRKKRKAADGASVSGLPPKKLREDHDDEVTFVIRSSMPPHPVLIAAVATTIITGATSALVRESGVGQVQPSIFRDFASPSVSKADVADPSQPVSTELSAGSFYVSQDMDPETLRQVYIPKWNVINDSVLDDLDVCRGMIDHLAPSGFFSQLWGMDYKQLLAEFNVGTARQVCFSAEIRMRLEHELGVGRKAEAVEVIRLHGQVAVVEAAKAARASELNGLKERNAVLEGQIAALEFTTVNKDAELASSNAQVAKVTQNLSSLRLTCDELSVKASSLEFEKDKLVDQTTCSNLCDEVIGYKLFKERVEAVQDEQVKPLSDRVVCIDSNLMEMALHMDEEFYPRYLTTIAGRRWILSRGLKLVIMKCLQSPEYLAALGGVIGRAIDKGMQDGLAADIDHGKARRGLVDVAAYNSSAEAYYVAAINALRAMDFTLLAQLESQKDASMADIMDLIRLEGPAAETPEASQLQPSPEQLMRIRGDDAACRLSLTDAMVPLIEPLSVKSLTGEASTFGVPAIAMTTGLSTTFIQANIVLPTPSTEVPPSLNIVFEQEELDTTP
ncbi:hypothetical protein Tco_1384206 [Tanacetum coccineum]